MATALCWGMLMATATPTHMGIRMTMRTTMATDTPALLHLIWLASPALPVGGFSYSEGLEAAIDHGLVHDEASCTQWLLDQLLLTQARGDMAAMAQAIPAWQAMDKQRLQALNEWVLATRESSEMRLQTRQMGNSLLEWLRNLQHARPEIPAVPGQLAAHVPAGLCTGLVHHAGTHRPELASLRVWLGREHDPGGPQSGAIGSEQRPTHARRPGALDSRSRANGSDSH